MFQVSVLVLTYNPDLQKLLLTLRGVLAQKDVDFEIIVSDDGSPMDNHFDQLEVFFREAGFSHYQLVGNPVNQGTVKNCIQAVEAASGDYVFFTSPGDVLFDETTLSDFYRFAKKQKLKLCFGNPVHYCMSDSKPVLTQEYSALPNPSLYKQGKPLCCISTPFMQGNFVVGACFFRQRTAVIPWLKAAAETAVFMEDGASTAYALAEGVPLVHYDRNIVWYEDGTGISTGGSDVWAARIRKDWHQTVFRLRERYPANAAIDLAYLGIKMPDSKKCKLLKFCKHPLATLCGKLNRKFSPVQKIRCTAEDLQRLGQL